MGTGEVGRYLGTYGPARVSKAMFVACLEPFLLRTDDNPHGVDGAVMAASPCAAVKDRHAYFRDFCANLYNTDAIQGRRVSDDMVESSVRAACSESVYASVAAAITWSTDFRGDVAKIAEYDIVVMILHGTQDRIFPIDATARPLYELLPRARYVEVVGAPHGLLWTYAN